MNTLRPTFVFLILLSLLFGGIYPLVMTGMATNLFPQKAAGSLIRDKQGRILGSELIAQGFTEPQYFWARPSATTPAYNAASSSGSNLGVNNPALLDAVKERIEALHKADPSNTAPIPADLVTASGSGLDPHISVEAAEYQVSRVALAQGMRREKVRELVKRYTEERQFGMLGEPRVNVLKLNLALESKL